MPVVRTNDIEKPDMDDEDQKKYHYRAPPSKLASELQAADQSKASSSKVKGKSGKGKNKEANEYTRSVATPTLTALWLTVVISTG